MSWTDWAREEPNFPTCECSDAQSSTPDWMAITRGKSGKAPQTAEDAERKHRKKDKARTIYGMAVMLHLDGTMEIGSRTYFRKKYVIQNDRIRDAVETGKPLVSRGKTYFMRNATPEEEANV